MVRDTENITFTIKYEVVYLPSNGVIANFVHCSLDLHFQVHKIRSANIWKTLKTKEKCLIMTFIDIDIRHRMVHLRRL